MHRFVLAAALLFAASCLCPRPEVPPPPAAGECEAPLPTPDSCSVAADCDDGDDCTAEICSAAACSVEVMGDGSPCGAHGGVCIAGLCCDPGE